MSGNGNQEENRRHKAAEHMWPVFSQIFRILVHVLAADDELVGNQQLVVGIEGSVHPCHVHGGHDERDRAKFEAARIRNKQDQLNGTQAVCVAWNNKNKEKT